MPRANRHFLPGYIWHITHRCHQKQFLLKFIRETNVGRKQLPWELGICRQRHDAREVLTDAIAADADERPCISFWLSITTKSG
jgi:hypothetical protein